MINDNATVESPITVSGRTGNAPTVVAWPEVFGALQTGVVDAQENPLYLIYTTKLYEVQSHVMLTAHVMIDGTDASLDLLHVIQMRITMDFGIKHMTIQLETECCEHDDIHCDLRKLADHHHEAGMFAHHH